MRRKTSTVVLATVLICLGLAGCGNTARVGTASNTSMSAANLYSWKTAFVGDNSAVSRIASTLPYPAGVEYGSIAIQSKHTPYGLTVKLTNSSDAGDNGDNSLFDSAAATFALIGNVDTITYDDAQTGKSIVTYTRKQVDNKLQQRNHPSIKELNSSEAAFKNYVGNL